MINPATAEVINERPHSTAVKFGGDKQGRITRPMNEIIWHILLTVCLGSSCVEQDVQWFDDKADCDKMITDIRRNPC